MLFVTLTLTLGIGACVYVDPKTNQTIPRKDQRYEYKTVQRRAENLEMGMPKLNVLMLLGSPAERSRDGDVWVYVPERAAVLIPARALRLEFADGVLVDYGYRPIVLGENL